MKIAVMRMRRGSMFVCLCFLFIFAGAKVNAADELKQALSAAVDRIVAVSLRSRTADDSVVTGEVLDMTRDDVTFSPQVRLHGSLKFSGSGGEKVMDMDVHGKSLSVALKKMEDEAIARLRYDGLDILGISISDSTVAYAWRNSLSLTGAPDGMREGDVYHVIDAKGVPHARVRVRRIGSEAESSMIAEGNRTGGEVELDTFWRSTVQPGMSLEPVSPWSVSLSGSAMYLLLDGGYRTWGAGGRITASTVLYQQPLSLLISLGASPLIVDLKGYISYDMMVGIGMDMPLGSRLDSTFTLLQDGSLTASAAIGIGIVPGIGISYVATWRAGYRHQISSSWAWGISGGTDTRVLRSGDTRLDSRTVLAIEPSLTYFF
ncbi:hypothetical protein Spico_1460 [Parasphaerochaeta coccoides DSM 17374]|uniref:Outer membrane protein beta-barrel domain-containing protein n=2 Tax=Parasphaerochaeta TaxID=3062336 RepID=F4GI65_PARC1|nr:hypothetical protein Spico_1460 [Parasphaerochaeta coccoides DSM 17374]